VISEKFNWWLKIIIFMGLLCVFAQSCTVSKPGKFNSTNDNLEQFNKKNITAPVKNSHESRKTGPLLKPEGPIEITIEDAILFAFENNRSLIVEKFNPSIRRTFEDQESAIFDPMFTGEVTTSYEKIDQIDENVSLTPYKRKEETDLEIEVSKLFPSGTDVAVNFSEKFMKPDTLGDLHKSRLGLSVTQALLRGARTEANLVRIRQARLDTHISRYELRGFAGSLLAQIEKTYWNYALAIRQIEIYQESLKLEEQHVRETKEYIEVGKLAESELTAAQAEIALRRQDLINARSTMEKIRLFFIRLLNPPGQNIWQRKILLLDQPAVPEVKLDSVKTHVMLALRMRSDLNQARLKMKRGELEIIKTKNGLLPKMDLFITLGKTGYAESFGDSINNLTGDGYDLLAGAKFQYPIGNKGAQARYRQSFLIHEKSKEAVENLTQLIEFDVQTSYIEVNRAKDQISATKSIRKLQEEKLKIEIEKFRVGRSTNFLVAQAQHDLVSSKISEVRAVVNYIKALVELYRLEGSLLERRGIFAPGREPVS